MSEAIFGFTWDEHDANQGQRAAEFGGLGPRGNTGETGATGAAGPNELSTATTAMGTIDAAGAADANSYLLAEQLVGSPIGTKTLLKLPLLPLTTGVGLPMEVGANLTAGSARTVHASASFAVSYTSLRGLKGVSGSGSLTVQKNGTGVSGSPFAFTTTPNTVAVSITLAVGDRLTVQADADCEFTLAGVRA